MKSSTIASTLAFGAVVGVALALAACDSGPEAVAAPKVEALPPVTQTAVAVAPIVADAPRSFVGVVTTKQSKVVVAEFEGRIESLMVQSGQTVRAGDPIARLDSSQLAKSVDALRSQVSGARSAVIQAGIDASEARRRHRLEQNLERGGSSTMEAVRGARADVARAGAQRAQLASNYEGMVAQYERAEELLQHATVTAPLDGQVSTIRLKEGEMAVAGTPIARIFDPSDRWVRFAIPADMRDAAIKVGARVEVTVPGATAGQSPVVLPATVTAVSSVLEPPLQLTVVEADLDDTRPDTALAAVGTTVDVRRMP